jgi:hypothetical protein
MDGFNPKHEIYLKCPRVRVSHERTGGVGHGRVVRVAVAVGSHLRATRVLPEKLLGPEHGNRYAQDNEDVPRELQQNVE